MTNCSLVTPLLYGTGRPRPRLLILAAAMLVALPVATGLPSTTHWLAALNDAGHAPLFAALAWSLHAAFEHGRTGLARDSATRVECGARARVFGATLLLGAGVEAAQAALGRGASAFDLLMDAAGAAVALAAIELRQRKAADRTACGVCIATIALALALVIAPLVEVARAYAQRARDWPALIGGAQLRAGRFVTVTGAQARWRALPAEWASEPGEHGLELLWSGEAVAGLRWDEPRPDWRGYATLELELINPTDRPLRWMLRIHDARHDQRHDDRFNRPIDLPARSRQIVRISLEEVARAPVGRTLDLSRVRGMVLFDRNPDVGLPGTLWVGRAVLIQSARNLYSDFPESCEPPSEDESSDSAGCISAAPSPHPHVDR